MPRVKNHGMAIRRISKKELAVIFRFFSPGSGRTKTTRLRSEVFTDLVLQELGIAPDVYRRRRVFPPAETKKIIEYFKIDENELFATTGKAG